MSTADEDFEKDFPGDKDIRRQLLLLWRDRAFRASVIHYKASELYEFRNKILTLFNMGFAIAVLFFANNKLLGNSNGSEFSLENILIAIGSLFTVITTAIQYLVRYEERSMQHKLAANEFSNLKRKIERYITIDKISNYLLHNTNRDYNFISKNYPLYSKYIWSRAKEDLDVLYKQDASFVDLLKARQPSAGPDLKK